MRRQDRIDMQNKLDEQIRKKRHGKQFIIKGDSLFTKACKLGLATDMPFNRATRRAELKKAVITERKAVRLKP